MKKLIKYVIVGFLLITIVKTFGQDFHFTQYQDVAQYQSPAKTAVYHNIHNREGDYRVALDVRSQWRAVGIKPFNSVFASYDQKIDRFGVGGYIVNNRSSSGSINVLHFIASGNYHIIERDQPHMLTVGMNMGLFHKNFRPDQFTYDNQYSSSAGGFDKSLSSGEAFEKTTRYNFDMGLGMYYKLIEEGKDVKPYAGISVLHLNRPNESFYGAKEPLPMRWVAQLGVEYIVTDEFSVDPTLQYMYQNEAYDFIMGMDLYYKLDDLYGLVGGFGYRWEDAVLFQLGVKHGRNLVKMSYDFNTSALKTYSGGRGAFEISLIFTGVKGEPFFEPRFH